MIEYDLQYYTLKHEIELPSKMSDYDYDLARPNRRFLSTFLHKVIFCDKITGIEYLNMNFASEACACIIAGLKNSINLIKKIQEYTVPEIMYGEEYGFAEGHTPYEAKSNLYVVRNIFISNSSWPVKAVISPDYINGMIDLYLSFYQSDSKIQLTTSDAEDLINILEENDYNISSFTISCGDIVFG